MGIKETPIQRAILDYLNYEPKVAFAYRQNTGAVNFGPEKEESKHKHLYDEARDSETMRMFGSPKITERSYIANQEARYVAFGVPGQADISGQMKTGIRLEIEVKDLGKWPTEKQWRWLLRTHYYNGVAGIARSIEDAQAIIYGKQDLVHLARRKAPKKILQEFNLKPLDRRV